MLFDVLLSVFYAANLSSKTEREHTYGLKMGFEAAV